MAHRVGLESLGGVKDSHGTITCPEKARNETGFPCYLWGGMFSSPSDALGRVRARGGQSLVLWSALLQPRLVGVALSRKLCSHLPEYLCVHQKDHAPSMAQPARFSHTSPILNPYLCLPSSYHCNKVAPKFPN